MSKYFISNNNESPRIFKNDFFELLSKTPWYLPIITTSPFLAVFLIYSLSSELSLYSIVLYALLGLVFWTFVEYLLHRFIFHFHPKSEFGKKLHWTFHGVHHDFPKDSYRLVFPPFLSIVLGSVFYLMFYLSLPNKIYFPFSFGFFSGYLIYDIGHYAYHHFAFKNKLFLKLKKHHMSHHYKTPDENFGVSSPLWDYIFNTKPKSK